MPATWPSAPTMVPHAQPSRARRAAIIMVELMLWNHSISRPGKRSRTEETSKGIDAAVDIHRASGVRDGPGGDEIGPRLGVGANVRERDAAGNFRLGAM